MTHLDFIDYIKLRLKGRRTCSIVGDLLDDMEHDTEKLEELHDLSAISSYIESRACTGAWEAYKRFRSQYFKYCREHGLEPDPKPKRV